MVDWVTRVFIELNIELIEYVFLQILDYYNRCDIFVNKSKIYFVR